MLKGPRVGEDGERGGERVGFVERSHDKAQM